MDSIQEWWHDFKIWLCAEEVGFFQQEIERYQFILTERDKEILSIKAMDILAFNQLNNDISTLKAERQAMMLVDPTKIVKTDEIVVDEMGRPMRKKILTIGDEKLSPELSRILREECVYIKRTLWWGLVRNTVKNAAKLTMFESAKDFDDMKTGKAILYADDIAQKIMDRILE